MTDQQMADITRVVEAYKAKKVELMEKVKEIEDLHKQGRILLWHKDLRIEELYKDLAATSERKEFVEYAQKANTDDEFEKYFRAAHLKAYFNIFLDPKLH
jgi:hypothetical protein